MSPPANARRRPAWQTAIRSVLWVLACGVATLALWFAFDLVYVSTGNETDHAARLYNRGLALHIIPTGGLTGPPHAGY